MRVKVSKTLLLFNYNNMAKELLPTSQSTQQLCKI